MAAPHRSTDTSLVMTLYEVADYIRAHYTTVYRMVRRGELPAFKIGDEYRVRRSELNRWIQRSEQETKIPRASRVGAVKF